MDMAEAIFVSIFCIISPIFLLGVTYFVWKDVRGFYRNGFIPNVIFFFVAYKLFAYFLLPALLRVISGYQYVKEDKIQLLSLAELYALEVLSYLIWLFAFTVVIRLIKKYKFPEPFDPEGFLNKHSRPSWNESFLMIFVCIGFILYSLSLIFSFSNPLFTLFRSLFVYGGMVVSIYLLVLGCRSKMKLHIIIGLITLLFSLSYIQSRGAMVYGFIWLIFLLSMYRMKRALYAGLALFIVVAIVLVVFKGLPKLGFIDPDTGAISVSLEVDDQKSAGRSLMDDIEWRFGANTRMSTSFIGMYDRGESAGINPIKHSLLGFLPRSINPEKPHPSTLDPNDIYSQGMYMIYREVHGYDTYSMVEFSTAGHFYWEFGLLGILVLSIVSSCYIVCSTVFFEKLGLAGIPLVVVLFKPWGYMDPKIWISDAILQIYQVILPLLLIYIVLWVIPRLKFSQRRVG